jgi:hypothetical protein
LFRSGKVIVPVTAWPLVFWRVRVICIIGVFYFIVIIDTHYRAGKGSDLSECHEKRLMDLSLRLNKHSRKEKCEPADREDGGCDKLYDSFFHIRYF